MNNEEIVRLPVLVPSCQGCSGCCREQGLPPGYTAAVMMSHIPKVLRDDLEKHLAAERRAGITRNRQRLPCVWLDPATGHCLHYEHRPPLCRAIRIASDACSQWRTKFGFEPYAVEHPVPEIYEYEYEAQAELEPERESE